MSERVKLTVWIDEHGVRVDSIESAEGREPIQTYISIRSSGHEADILHAVTESVRLHRDTASRPQ